MVGPYAALTIDDATGPRWDAAIQLLANGEAPIQIGVLVLSSDPASANEPRRLHVEFDCPYDPSQVGKAPQERLGLVAQRDLDAARQSVDDLCRADERFATLMAESGLVYEYVHRYGMGALLVASAGATGDLNWR
jgi:hypothetical protein